MNFSTKNVELGSSVVQSLRRYYKKEVLYLKSASEQNIPKMC